MTPQVFGQIPFRKVYYNDSSSVGQIDSMTRKVYSMTPEVLVRYLEKYIQ